MMNRIGFMLVTGFLLLTSNVYAEESPLSTRTPMQQEARIYASQDIVYQDVVYLKNGSIIKGLVVEQIPNVSIKIRTADGNIFVLEMNQITKIAKEPGHAQTPASDNRNIRDEKSPGKAFALSLILPGLGQYYVGDVGTGIIQQLLFAVGLVRASAKDGEDTNVCETRPGQSGCYYRHIEGTDRSSERISGAVICIAVEIWSLIDAPISAGRVNWEKRHPYESMFEKDFGTSVLGVNLTPTPQGAMVTATLHF